MGETLANEMNQEQSRFQYLFTAFAFISIGALVFLIQPVFLGTLAEALQLGPRQIGILAASDMIGTAMVSGSGRPQDLRSGLNAGVVLVLMSFLSLQAASGAYWAFLERIGYNAQLSPVAIGGFLGAATLIGALGSVTAATLGTRIGRRIPMAAGFILYGAGLACIHLPLTGLTFALSVFLLFYAWNLILPYQFGLLAHYDTSGKYLVLAAAMQAGGIAVGPVIASQFISGANYINVTYTSLVLMLLTVAVLASVAGKPESS